jgi:hypothetical protein
MTLPFRPSYPEALAAKCNVEVAAYPWVSVLL